MRSHSLALTAALFAGLTVQDAPQAFSSHPDLGAPDALTRFTLDGSGTWEIKDKMLVLAKAGTPGGPIRRPSALAVLQSEPLVRATVQVELRSTAPEEVKNRDLEIIVGCKDRRRIDDGTAAPQLKDREWHRVRLERDGDSGRIEVFVDGSEQPALHATNTTIRAGRVGLGSFDDTGEFRRFGVAGYGK